MNCVSVVFVYHTARERPSRQEENEKNTVGYEKAKQIVRFLIDPASHGVSVVTCLVGFFLAQTHMLR